MSDIASDFIIQVLGEYLSPCELGFMDGNTDCGDNSCEDCWEKYAPYYKKYKDEIINEIKRRMAKRQDI